MPQGRVRDAGADALTRLITPRLAAPVDAVVCGFFVLLVLAMCVYTVKICRQALRQA